MGALLLIDSIREMAGGATSAWLHRATVPMASAGAPKDPAARRSTGVVSFYLRVSARHGLIHSKTSRILSCAGGVTVRDFIRNRNSI